MKIFFVCSLLSITLVCGTSLSNSQSDGRNKLNSKPCCTDILVRQTKEISDSLAVEIDRLNRKTIELLFCTKKMDYAKKELIRRYGRVKLDSVRKVHSFVATDTTIVYVVELNDGALLSPVKLTVKDSLTLKNKKRL